MIRVRIQIGDDPEPKDTYDDYGLCYLDSDDRLAPPVKGFEKTAYPEEDGEHTDGKTVDDAFDYKVHFLVEAANSDKKNANTIIDVFNKALYTPSVTPDNDVKTYRRVTFFNDYKRVKITGYPSPIAEAMEFWRDKYGNVADAVKVELVIRVTDPQLCEFDTDTDAL